MKKTVLNYGAIAAVITTTMMLISKTLHNRGGDSTGSEIIGFTGMFLAFIFIFLGIKNYRDKQNNGHISFGMAFKIGFLICFIASSTYVLTWMICSHYFFPDFMEKYVAQAMEAAQKSGFNSAELAEKQLEMNQYIEWYKNPLLKILLTYTEILPLGLLVTLVSALILEKK